MTKEFTRTWYEEVNIKVKGFCDGDDPWLENSDGNADLFVGFAQLFSEKTAMKSQVSGISRVTGPCHLMASARRKQ